MEDRSEQTIQNSGKSAGDGVHYKEIKQCGHQNEDTEYTSVRKKNGDQAIFKKILASIFSELRKDISPHIRTAQAIPRKMNFIVKLQNNKDKDKYIL